MITIEDIISVLVPNFIRKRLSAAPSTNVIDGFDLRGGHENLLNCILDHFGKTPDDIVHFLSTSTINRNVNKKKMITMIRNGYINNELVLFISGYFDCNIWMYYAINKIFKVFYLEEHYQPYKKNIFIFNIMPNDSSQYMYYVGHPKESLDGETLFKNIRERYITIPLGIKENKTWASEKTEDNPLYADLEMEGFVDDCPVDPIQYPRFNVMRLLETFKI